MKTAILVLIIVANSFSSISQCADLYTKEHISGDPLCRLYKSNSLKVCLDAKTVRGGSCTFYIKQVRDTYSGMEIDLTLDNVHWAQKYAELIINTKTQRFAFVIGSSSGVYSYYTEEEFQRIRGAEQLAEKKAQQEIKRKNQSEDRNTKREINKAISRNELFKAKKLAGQLHYNDPVLVSKVDEFFNPLIKEINELYADYLKSFDDKRNEYKMNPDDFIKNNADYIEEKICNIEGEKGYLKRIESSPEGLKKYRKSVLAFERCLYHQKDGMDYISFIGLNYWYYGYKCDSISIKVNSVDSLDYIWAQSEIFVDGTVMSSQIIVNNFNFPLNNFVFPFSGKLKEYITQAKNQGAFYLIEKECPEKNILLSKTKVISFENVTKQQMPKDGFTNPNWDNLNNEFQFINKDIERYIKDDIYTSTVKINPSLLYLAQNIFHQSDSLIFVKGNFQKLLGRRAFHLEYETDTYSSYKRAFGSIIPLVKGSIEYIDGKVRIYSKDGSYKEEKGELVQGSWEWENQLKNFDISNCVLDSSFITPMGLMSKREKDMYSYSKYDNAIDEYPVYYSQQKPSNSQKRTYLYNDSCRIMQLPYTNLWPIIYNPDPRFNDGKEYYGLEAVQFWLAKDIKHAPQRKYFSLFNKYLKYKAIGEDAKASKTLKKLNEAIKAFG